MAAFRLQNYKKMARLIFTMVFIHAIILCVGQQATAENKILGGVLKSMLV